MSVIKVPGDFPTIQDAVNVARHGDVILVANGIYHEEVIIEKSDIRIVAEGNNAVLDGQGVLSNAFFLQFSFGTEIKGFKIENYVNDGILADVGTSICRFIGNRIKNVGTNGIESSEGSSEVLIWQNQIEKVNGNGIKIFGGFSFVLENHIQNINNHGIDINSTVSQIILKNKIDGVSGNGLQISFSGSVYILENHIRNSNGNGISLEFANAVITDNYIEKNKKNGIFVEQTSQLNVIEENVIEENDENGIEIDGLNNAIIRNKVENNMSFDIVDNGSNNHFVNNECMTSNPENICIEKVIGVIRVPSDQPSIQQAVNIAQFGDVILVADGEYHETVEVNKSFLRIVTEGTNAILNGKGILSSAFFLFSEEFIISGVEIKGFTINNYVNHGIRAQVSGGNSFIHNHIKNNRGNGIELQNTQLQLANLIWKNKIEKSLNGIRAADSTTANYLLDNNILNVMNNGIEMDITAFQFIWKNRVEKAGGSGIRGFGSVMHDIIENHIEHNNGSGVLLEGSLFFRGGASGSLIANNLINENKERGIFIDENFLNIVEENIVKKNRRNGIEFNVENTSLIRNKLDENIPFDIVDRNNHYVENQCNISNPDGICAEKEVAVIKVPRDQPTIQKAVHAAKPGDVILIANGVYHETIEVNTSFIRIIAEGDDVILNGKGILSNAFFLFPSSFFDTITGVEIKGVKIKNYCNDGILVVNGFFNSFISNRIKNVSGSGIELLTSNDNLIWKNEIRNARQDGIRDLGQGNNILENCVKGNKHTGISIEGNNFSNNLIVDNVIKRNNESGILIHPNSNLNIIQQNHIIENKDNGIEINGNNNSFVRNILKRNKVDIEDNGTGNHYVNNRCQTSIPTQICHNKIIRVIRVPSDQPTIQKAVLFAEPGDVILVQDGIYNEEVVVEKDLIRIISEGDHAILDGGNTLSNAFSLRSIGVEIKGFTIKNYTNDGILITFGNGNQLIRNHIKNVGGNGIELSENTQSSLIWKNTIEKVSGIGILTDSSTNYILDNHVKNNIGRGISINGGPNVLVNNIIQFNGGSGIFLSGDTFFIIIQGNKIFENKDDGIELHGGNHAVIQNELKNNKPFDIDDQSNNFIENTCETSNPAGICNSD